MVSLFVLLDIITSSQKEPGKGKRETPANCRKVTECGAEYTIDVADGQQVLLVY